MKSPLLPREVVLLLGMPASGKTTVGTILARAIGVPHISLGDLVRMTKKRASEVVPTDLLDDHLRQNEDLLRSGVVLDSSPQDPQGDLKLDVVLQRHGARLRCVIHLMRDKELARQSLLDRKRVDHSQSTLEETWSKRMKVYEDFIIPQVNGYGTQHLLVEIDTTGQDIKGEEFLARLVDGIVAVQ